MIKNKCVSAVTATGLLAVIALSGCNIMQPKEEAKQEIQAKNKQGHYGKDVKETTESAEKLPSFLSSARNKQVAESYKMTVENQDLLKVIPCYCGCGEEALHTSNKDCFISEVKDSGDIVWDSHAMNQAACV